MLVLVLGWLAWNRKGWVVLATGTALTAAGIGIFLAGITIHQPLISRAGVLVTLLAVIFAVLAVRSRRSRRSRVRNGPCREVPGQTHHGR
jgi:peptidoglycan/LPS O-acetylase OafA/YrhL